VPSTAVTEEFEYDSLNRLTGSAIGTDEKAFAYDSIGNMTSKSDVGSYSYPLSGSTSVRPHAVSSITGTVNGITNPSFTYDANGNMTAGLGRTVTWTSYNMVATVTRGTQELAFTYDSEHQRIKQGVTAANERTIYINAQVRSERLEVASSNALIRWNNYIYAGGEMVAVFYDNASTTDQTRFFHKDHLGSVSVITDEGGSAVQRLAYDSWGKRRNATTWADDPSEAIAPTVLTDRGYTGHEHLDEVALIHMNGRGKSTLTPIKDQLLQSLIRPLWRLASPGFQCIVPALKRRGDIPPFSLPASPSFGTTRPAWSGGDVTVPGISHRETLCRSTRTSLSRVRTCPPPRWTPWPTPSRPSSPKRVAR